MRPSKAVHPQQPFNSNFGAAVERGASLDPASTSAAGSGYYQGAHDSISHQSLTTMAGSGSTERFLEEYPTSLTFNPLASTLCRDVLLSYAQRDYLTLAKPGASRSTSIPLFQSPHNHPFNRVGNLQALLTTLKAYHPTHLPTLLLLSSMHFSSGDLNSSLEINHEILRIEPTYVEAMCNIGCIMHSINEPEVAYTWWWKALQLQPMYWDVMDNLLDLVLVNKHRGEINKHSEALAICDFVRSSLMDENGYPRQQIPREQLHKLQSVTYTRASVLQMTEHYSYHTPQNYSQVVNLALLTPQMTHAEQLTLRDLIFATCITGLFFMDMVPQKIMTMLGFEGGIHEYSPSFNILSTVHRLGDDLVTPLHDVGFDILPAVLLDPEQVNELPRLLFSAYHTVLPSNCGMDSSGNLLLLPEATRDITNQITSQALMMIAKYYQDSLGGASVGDGTFQSCRVSVSLVVILHYLALALYPSAIAYNNIGALISTSLPINLTKDKRPKAVDAGSLTTAFYQRGLQLVPDHAHLLTNLGSALKEKGDITNAISLYSRAVEIDPHLESALVNLASTLRDAGRPWDSIPFYKRVQQLKPTPDTTCGLASTLSAVCDWRGRGWLETEVEMVRAPHIESLHVRAEPGWIHDLAATCNAQLESAYVQNIGLLRRINSLGDWLRKVQSVHHDQPFSQEQMRRWERCLNQFFTEFDRARSRVNEGGFVIRLVEWLSRGLQRKWYIEEHGTLLQSERLTSRQSLEWRGRYERPFIPSVGHFPVPALQPFHTFSFPLEPRTIRIISHRNALRVSYRTLTQPWLPRHVYPPPPPPHLGRLNIGYVSYDFLNHPLAHLIQSVFGFHDPSKFNVHTYATSADDGSSYRQKIANESHVFVDVSTWSLEATINRIVEDQIHILINLGGFTRGSNNDIFAARPCPIQILMMGFPGSCGSGWCDYLLGDTIACPVIMRGEPDIRNEQGLHIGAEPDPESPADFIFTEKMIYMPHTFMVTDHLQSYGHTLRLSFVQEEQERYIKRRTIFPGLAQYVDFVLGNLVILMTSLRECLSRTFMQLYKVNWFSISYFWDNLIATWFAIQIDPVIFCVWLSILRQVPNSVLWLLRFPSAGEEHLKRTATAWAGDNVASRILFTDVATKEEHVRRGLVADLFLDTAECCAHTVAADILWSGTPLLTWPKHLHKMCSRVAASIANATGFGDQMVVQTIEEYERRAVALAMEAQAMQGRSDGTESELRSLRRGLHRDKYTMPLFDTKLWTKNFEKACWEAWERW
ncbi:hypothetical protein DXG01_007863 [Tephrocybe rancida]|nr:hypothetical protein DXG01_007863 [Tephrocybe rancida]